jgi:hypothetical protein
MDTWWWRASTWKYDAATALASESFQQVKFIYHIMLEDSMPTIYISISTRTHTHDLTVWPRTSHLSGPMDILSWSFNRFHWTKISRRRTYETTPPPFPLGTMFWSVPDLFFTLVEIYIETTLSWSLSSCWHDQEMALCPPGFARVVASLIYIRVVF